MACLHHQGITEEIFRRAASNIGRALDIPPNDEELATRKYLQASLTPFLDADGCWDPNAFSAAMDELLLYSLIEFDRVNEAFALHVLVQDWTFTMLSHSKATALMHTSHLLALSIDSSHDAEAYTYRRGLLLHVSGLLAKPNKTNANDACFLSLVYRDNGRWNEEEVLWAKALDTIKPTLGELHPDTLTSVANLASTYRNQGRWDEAEALDLRALNARKQTLGGLHSDTLTSMANLASTYWKQGRWDEAEVLEVQAVEKLKQTLGELHPNTLASMNNLALTYLNRGRWDEAEALQVQVLDTMKQTLGELHPDTLASMANLAYTYRSQGRWDVAEALDFQVLDFREQTLGELHPDTLTSMANLASTYRNQGRWYEAEVLEVQAVEKLKQTLGELHPDTLTSMNNLALTYLNLGRWDEAEGLQAMVLDARKRILGERHPDTLASMHSLASAFSRHGRLEEAETVQLQVLGFRKMALGEVHPDTLASMNHLARVYSIQGRNSETKALELEIEALGARRQTVKEWYPITKPLAPVQEESPPATHANSPRSDQHDLSNSENDESNRSSLFKTELLASRYNIATQGSVSGPIGPSERRELHAHGSAADIWIVRASSLNDVRPKEYVVKAMRVDRASLDTLKLDETTEEGKSGLSVWEHICQGKLFIGNDGNVKIGEFGLATLIQPFAGAVPSISYPGLRWSSPELVELELAQSAPTPTMASDVWALGCTAFEVHIHPGFRTRILMLGRGLQDYGGGASIRKTETRSAVDEGDIIWTTARPSRRGSISE
ncbi:hypothetical protein FRC12_020229 [Ceratobasidium sp. 428]|nr:hypothetical protein FRC12_020229 [Ceratobasidium sp. 428]